MQWILENLQIVLIAVIAIGSIAKKAWDAKADSNPPQPPEQIPETGSSDDEWHRPNPPQYSHLPVVPPPLPQAETEEAAAMLKRQAEMRERLRAAKTAKAEKAKKLRSTHSNTANEVPHAITLPALRSRSGLRQALILKEILARPVGLR